LLSTAGTTTAALGSLVFGTSSIMLPVTFGVCGVPDPAVALREVFAAVVFANGSRPSVLLI